MILPSDDFILLSLINTALRDKYGSFEELCAAEDIVPEEVTARLSEIGFSYNPEENAFK